MMREGSHYSLHSYSWKEVWRCKQRSWMNQLRPFQFCMWHFSSFYTYILAWHKRIKSSLVLFTSASGHHTTGLRLTELSVPSTASIFMNDMPLFLYGCSNEISNYSVVRKIIILLTVIMWFNIHCWLWVAISACLVCSSGWFLVAAFLSCVMC